jgi:hypothetical protein
VGRPVTLEVRGSEAAAVVWDLGAEVGGSAAGPRTRTVFRHIGRHAVKAVVLGERGTRRTLAVELDVRPGGGPSCAAGGACANWTPAGGVAIIGIALLALGNFRGSPGRSRVRERR